MTADIPALVAHRGYRRRYPENTQPAMEAAAEAGACYVECDIQLTADHVPVLCHDAGLARLTGRPGDIRALSWAALADYHPGEPARLGDRFRDVRFWRLDHFAAWLAARPRLQAFVEVKEEGIEAFGLDTVLDAVLGVLAPVLGRTVIISFSHAAVRRARAQSGVRIGWVLGRWSDLQQARALSPDFLFCNYKKIPKGRDPLPGGGWQWALYEIESPADALAWAGRGAGLIETFSIGELLADARLARGACR